jgi:hypothetical protein
VATIEFSILNHNLMFDTGVYPSRLDAEMTLTNDKDQACIVMPDPTGADLGLSGAFQIPQNYSSTPVMVARMVLTGTPANTIGVAAQQVSAAASESVDTAYEAEDTASNATWTGYADEDMYEITITLTPGAAYVAGDTVLFRFYRDDSVNTYTPKILLIDLLFRYTSA